MKRTHRQAGQTFASDKTPAEAQETHFRRVDRLPLGFDKQPIEGVRAGRFRHIFTLADLAEVPGTVQRLEEGIHITSCSLVFQSYKPSFLFGVVAIKCLVCSQVEHDVEHLLYKIMPQNTSRILQHSNINSDICRLIFNRGTYVTFLNIE